MVYLTFKLKSAAWERDLGKIYWDTARVWLMANLVRQQYIIYSYIVCYNYLPNSAIWGLKHTRDTDVLWILLGFSPRGKLIIGVVARVKEVNCSLTLGEYLFIVEQYKAVSCSL